MSLVKYIVVWRVSVIGLVLIKTYIKDIVSEVNFLRATTAQKNKPWRGKEGRGMGEKFVSGEYFDLELEKKEYIVFNKATGRIEKIHYDKYLDMEEIKNEPIKKGIIQKDNIE